MLKLEPRPCCHPGCPRTGVGYMLNSPATTWLCMLHLQERVSIAQGRRGADAGGLGLSRRAMLERLLGKEADPAGRA
jgi:hypothetical protein